MSWIKKGLILVPNAEYDWLQTAAGNCYATLFENDTIELIVSGRDELNRSRLGRVLINANTYDILQIADEPLIPLGELGTYDYNGTAYPWLVKQGADEYLYYTGWTIGYHVAFINDLGLAIRKGGDSAFKKISRATIMPRTDAEPFGTGSVCVLIENDVWKMWYTTFKRWGVAETDEKHYYHIRYAESSDGLNWVRNGKVCIDFNESDGEYVAAKPFVMKYKGLYLMWYSYRGPYYKIGFAVSENGIDWVRYNNIASLDASETGWDSEMVCYGFVVVHQDTLKMFYTGNGFGKSGLGLATMPLDNLDSILQSLGYSFNHE